MAAEGDCAASLLRSAGSDVGSTGHPSCDGIREAMQVESGGKREGRKMVRSRMCPYGMRRRSATPRQAAQFVVACGSSLPGIKKSIRLRPR